MRRPDVPALLRTAQKQPPRRRKRIPTLTWKNAHARSSKYAAPHNFHFRCMERAGHFKVVWASCGARRGRRGGPGRKGGWLRPGCGIAWGPRRRGKWRWLRSRRRLRRTLTESKDSRVLGRELVGLGWRGEWG